MYGKVLGTSTVVPGAAGVALLPDTGSSRLLFILSAIALTIGVVSLTISLVGTILRRRSHKV